MSAEEWMLGSSLFGSVSDVGSSPGCGRWLGPIGIGSDGDGADGGLDDEVGTGFGRHSPNIVPPSACEEAFEANVKMLLQRDPIRQPLEH